MRDVINLVEAQRLICQDQRRDRSIICAVEEPADVIPIERTHEYRGMYHVLGGALADRRVDPRISRSPSWCSASGTRTCRRW